MSRKDEIKALYGQGKDNSIYDGIKTGSSGLGRLLMKTVWTMSPEDQLACLSETFAGLPADFGGSVLELPVGTGVLSMPFWRSQKKAEITCLDPSENMLSMARERAENMKINNVHFVQGDVCALPFPDESFDAVVSVNGFHAFKDKDGAFSEVRRVLKPGGTFCGCFYCEGRNVKTDKMIRRFYVRTGYYIPPFETPESLRRRLSADYINVQVSNVKSIAVFSCVKA